MKIDEAIKLITSLQGETPTQLATPIQRALKLGIEALKRIQNSREHAGYVGNSPLLGETEE